MHVRMLDVTGLATTAKLGYLMVGAVGGSALDIFFQAQDPVERYTALGVLAAVVMFGLKIGGGVVKKLGTIAVLLQRLDGSVTALTKSMDLKLSQDADAHRTYAAEREKAVSAIKEHIDLTNARLLDAVKGGGTSAA